MASNDVCLFVRGFSKRSIKRRCSSIAQNASDARKSSLKQKSLIVKHFSQVTKSLLSAQSKSLKRMS